MDTPTDLKFCVNCKHIAKNGSMNWETFQCMHPNNEGRANLVTGIMERKEKYAMGVRCYGNMCGPEGIWFEQSLAKTSEYPPVQYKETVKTGYTKSPSKSPLPSVDEL